MGILPFDAAVEMLRRREARRSLHAFIRYINPDYIVSDFSRTVCAELDGFIKNLMAGNRPVLIIQAPPQHGKSDIVSRYLPAYIFGLYPDLSIAGLSYAMELASEMNQDVQQIMMSPEYEKLFPKSVLGVKIAGGIRAKQNSVKFGIPGHTGYYRGAGVGGPLTGRKVNLGIIDDPIKNAAEALSEVVKNGLEQWYESVFLTRMAKISGQIIMATAWAQDDLAGRVIEKNPRAKVLKFQAIDDLTGKALVPELHPLDQLLEIKAVLSNYFWAAMYQSSPVALGGNVFRSEFAQYYLTKDLPEKFDKVVMSWDCTFKDTDGTDYVVGQVWGKYGANAYLLDQVRARMSFTATKKGIQEQADKWPEARRKLVEDKANGPAVIDSLKATVPGLIPVEPDGSKLARAHAVTFVWESRNVFLPHKDIAPWVVGYVNELTAFPAAANDDQVDATTQALRDLYPMRRIPMKINPDVLNQLRRRA